MLNETGAETGPTQLSTGTPTSDSSPAATASRQQVIARLTVPAVRESFVPAFSENKGELQKYFTDPTREYFSIYYNDQPVESSAARTLTCKRANSR